MSQFRARRLVTVELPLFVAMEFSAARLVQLPASPVRLK